MIRHTQHTIRQMRSLIHDEAGNLSLAGIVLMTTITSLGAIVGLATYRDHVIQSFGDASVALRNLRQEYKYEVVIDANGNGIFGDGTDCVLSGSFSDAVDLVDEVDEAPACMELTAAIVGEQE